MYLSRRGDAFVESKFKGLLRVLKQQAFSWKTGRREEPAGLLSAQHASHPRRAGTGTLPRSHRSSFTPRPRAAARGTQPRQLPAAPRVLPSTSRTARRPQHPRFYPTSFLRDYERQESALVQST